MSEDNKIPEEFSKVIKDFIGDLKETFPEYKPLINKWWKEPEEFNYIDQEDERNKAIQKAESHSLHLLFNFAQKKLPPRFFDILYQNEDMFKDDSSIDTEFLPHIYFKNLWQFDISQKTRDTIWKYLQLILFSIVGTLDNKDAFGDTAKMFDTINQDDFKSKLEETLSKMQDLFTSSEEKSEEESESGPSLNMEDMPNAQDIHEHITGMLDGKLGKLAREIAEETAADINMDMENVTDMKDIFNNLIKNPTKLMGLVKNVGEKLDTRIKSGELKESELMAEASDLINKMKNMKGMGDIQSMLSKMGLNGMGNLGGLGGKLNTGAMEAELNKNIKLAQTKERLRSKAEASRLAKEKQKETPKSEEELKPAISEEEILKIFSTGETVERTPRQNNNKKGKKAKGKK